MWENRIKNSQVLKIYLLFVGANSLLHFDNIHTFLTNIIKPSVVSVMVIVKLTLIEL